MIIRNRKQKQKSKYICNGKTMYSYEEVLDYCGKHKFRITNTETIARGVHLISVSSK